MDRNINFNNKYANIPETASVLETVQDNIHALQQHDVSAYLDTIDTTRYSIDELNSVRSSLQTLFERYFVKYSIESSAITEFDGENATVQLIQTAYSEDPSFTNHRTSLRHHLTKHNSRWCIVSSETLWFDPL